MGNMKITNQYKAHRTSGASGFTLIEVMVVVAIIAVLATMTVGGLSWYKRKAAIGKTEVLVNGLSRALEEYRLDNGFFPQGDGGTGSSEQVYIALYGDGELVSDGSGNVTIGTAPTGASDPGNTVYLAILNPDLQGSKLNVESSAGSYSIIDSWGLEINYRSPGVMNPADDFDLWSLGPDGRGGANTGTQKERADDTKNW